MGNAFDTFNQFSDTAVEGQLQDRNMADVVSRIAGEDGINFGHAVHENSHREARLPTGAEASQGITLREEIMVNPDGSNPEAVYNTGDTMSVVRVGRAWVNTVDGSNFGDDVFVVPDTGELTNTASGGTNIQLANAAFKSDAAAGELALVQLNGAE